MINENSSTETLSLNIAPSSAIARAINGPNKQCWLFDGDTSYPAGFPPEVQIERALSRGQEALAAMVPMLSEEMWELLLKANPLDEIWFSHRLEILENLYDFLGLNIDDNLGAMGSVYEKQLGEMDQLSRGEWFAVREVIERYRFGAYAYAGKARSLLAEIELIKADMVGMRTARAMWPFVWEEHLSGGLATLVDEKALPATGSQRYGEES